MVRVLFGAAGLYMLTDALISANVSTDKRPSVQAGRALRGAIGVGLSMTALLKKPVRNDITSSFWMGTLSSVVGGIIVASALTATGKKAIAT